MHIATALRLKVMLNPPKLLLGSIRNRKNPGVSPVVAMALPLVAALLAFAACGRFLLKLLQTDGGFKQIKPYIQKNFNIFLKIFQH
jgi:hypothetical protein